MDLRAYIETQPTSRVGHRDPVTVTPDATIGDSAAVMRKHAVGCVLIAEGDSLLGIFTERDLLRKVLAKASRASLRDSISSVMTADPVIVRTNDPLADLLRLMHEGGFRHLPLLDASDRLVGTISMKRVVSFLADQFAAMVYNLPPDPDNFGARREGA